MSGTSARTGAGPNSPGRDAGNDEHANAAIVVVVARTRAAWGDLAGEVLVVLEGHGRSRVRNVIGPRVLALSSVSASTPPNADVCLDRCTNGIERRRMRDPTTLSVADLQRERRLAVAITSAQLDPVRANGREQSVGVRRSGC